MRDKSILECLKEMKERLGKCKYKPKTIIVSEDLKCDCGCNVINVIKNKLTCSECGLENTKIII